MGSRLIPCSPCPATTNRSRSFAICCAVMWTMAEKSVLRTTFRTISVWTVWASWNSFPTSRRASGSAFRPRCSRRSRRSTTSRSPSDVSRASPRTCGPSVPSSRLAAVALVALAVGTSGLARAWQDAGTKAGQSDPVTLDGLLARFRSISGLYARYREDKRIALLAEPIVSEGTIHYAPPRRMARHTRTPSPAHVVLDGEALRFSDGTTTQQIDIGASPVVRALAESFLDVLAGDRAGLERSFVIEFHAGDAANHASTWKLDLVPRTPELLGVLSEIHFEGQGLVVSQMRIREASGDEGTTTFSDVDVSHRYSPEEAARVFRV